MQFDSTTMYEILLVVAVLIAGVVISVFNKKTGNNKKAKEDALGRFYIAVYKAIYNVPILGDTLRRITIQVQSLYVYSKRDSYKVAAKYFLMAYGASCAIIIASILLYKDLVSILVCFVFSMVCSNVLINKRVNKLHALLYKDLKITVSSIRQEYMKYGSVVEALQECETGELVRNSIDDIINMLTTANGEIQLQEFFQRVPFRTIQTLARICYNVNNVGDEVDSDGKSNFVQALTLITSDVNNELEKLELIKLKFGIIEYLPLVAVLGVKPVEMGFGNVMPATKILYDGMFGYISCIVIILIGAFCYNYVSNINNESALQINDNLRWVQNLLKNKAVKSFVMSITPKGSRRRKLEGKLKDALSRKTVAEVYVEKITYFIVAFIASIIIIASMVNVCKVSIYNTRATLGLSSETITDPEEIAAIEALDAEFFKRCDEALAAELAKPRLGGEEVPSMVYISDEEATNLIGSYRRKLSDMEKADELKRLKDKYRIYSNIYFHWWFILICGGLAIGAFWIPNWLIKNRIDMVDIESEEDFLQLQSLMTVLMNSDCDTLEALEQLTDISKIHKDALTYCMHSYPSNPELELARLASKTPLLDFKRFVGKLQLTVNDLSLREAFSDLIVEREYITTMRKMNTEHIIESKRTKCGGFALAPIIMMVMSAIVVPIGYLGVTEIMSSMANLSSM